ncbi:MAG: TetR/AcrR family transcriptional regulator [Alphaproteobacteria bacterium]|nr:TetR/AcrR family transcriptional regulator [Alphaproteobacteria bacterium]MBU2143093.1 TetR/AcrR family transcriptional regulator [Alphaproteobacteria bacterium]
MTAARKHDSKDTEPLSRGDKRRAAFIAAARQVFLEQGYEAASMSEIVLRAGGSLSTLYSQFGDKQGLFIAMLDARVRSITQSMGVELSAHTPVEEGLRRIGEQFTSKLLEPESLEMYRLIIGLARKFPEIPREFQRRGPDKIRLALTEYLIDREEAGEIHLEDPYRAASLFLEMTRSGLVSRALLDDDIRPDAEEIRTSVNMVVNMFLHGIIRYQPDPAAGASDSPNT